MLKELWRKLGSDFFHSSMNESEQPSDAVSARKASKRKVDIMPHMTHTGEFHLERLMSLLNARYNKVFNQKGDESVRQMIHFASRIQDQDVQRELLLFYLNCSPFIQEYLRSEDVLDGDHFLNQTSGRSF